MFVIHRIISLSFENNIVFSIIPTLIFFLISKRAAFIQHYSLKYAVITQSCLSILRGLTSHKPLLIRMGFIFVLVSLFLWFAGGGGSRNVNAALEFVDEKEFLIVAFPFPKSHPHLVKVWEDQTDPIVYWDYHLPMLEDLKKRVPNISLS